MNAAHGTSFYHKMPVNERLYLLASKLSSPAVKGSMLLNMNHFLHIWCLLCVRITVDRNARFSFVLKLSIVLTCQQQGIRKSTF